MDFKQQYKTEMQNISPSEEQCERIRAKVYEAIQNPPNSQNVQAAPKRKKPLPLKAIAITGASAACLVLISALALKILPTKEYFSGGTCDFAPNGINAMEAERNDLANNINAGGGVAPEAYDADSLSPTSVGSVGLDSKGAFEEQDSSFGEKTGSAESLAPGSLVVKMVFSEDMSECEVYEGKQSRKYALSDEAPLTEDNEELLTELPAINSNIEKPLFIYTSGDKMWVYDENNEFIGCFIQIQ